MYKRLIDLEVLKQESCFLWGPRQAGKTTLLKSLAGVQRQYDLLESETFRRFATQPELLREECRLLPPEAGLVVIDEVQKIPDLLNEIHWLMSHTGLRFLLSGSSARKLKRLGTNLLGGRAIRRALFPLCWKEIPDFNLERALSVGTLPKIYTSLAPRDLLRAYIADYLKEEIYAESLVRNLPAFSRFLDIVAQGNGEIVVYANIARDVGVSAAAIKDYYSILVDTLLGDYVPSFLLRPKRRMIQAPRFYLFDVGVCGTLMERGDVSPRSESFGRAFEHFVWQELRAYSEYSLKHFSISYWHTSSDLEVDFILGKARIALEVKSTETVHSDHLKGLRAFVEEYPEARRIVVSRDPRRRTTDDAIEILPWHEFFTDLWDGKVL